MPRTAARHCSLVVLLTALLAGCSTAMGSTQPKLPHYATLNDLGAALGAQMRAARTARISIAGGTTGGQVQANTSGDGALRYDDQGRLSVTLTERVQPANSQTVTELGLIVLPDQAFVRPPAESGQNLPPGKSWIRLRPDATDPVSRRFEQLVRSVRQNADPRQSFAQFGDAAAITETADETVDGIPAVRYLIHVDLARAAANQTDPAAKQALGQAVQSGLRAVESTLWVDARNQPLRVVLHQPLPAGQGAFTVDARYRDWGQPVRIGPPPADQVVAS